MPAPDDLSSPAPVADPLGSADLAAVFARRAARVLSATGVLLWHGDRRTPLAAWGDAGPDSAPDGTQPMEPDRPQAQFAALCEPVCTDPVGDYMRSVVPVIGDDSIVRAWLAAFWRRDRPDRRQGVALRVLARTAAVVLESDGEDVALSDRLVLSGAGMLTELALTATTFDQVLGGAAAVIAPLVVGTTVGIAVTNERGYLQALPGSFGAPSDLVASSQVSHTELTTAAAGVFRTGRPMLANRPSVDIPRFFEWVQGFGIHRLMTLPILVGGVPLGVVHVANKPTAFTEEDAALVGRLMPFVAGAVGQVQQRLDMHRREELSTVVGRAATAVAAGVRLHDFVAYLEELRAALDCRTALLRFHDAQQRHLVVAAETDAHAVEADIEFLSRSDAASSGLRTAMSRPSAPGELGWATLHVPILVDGSPRATLALLRVPCVPLSDAEQAAVRRMAGIVALAWTTDRYLEKRAESALARERARIADDIHDRAVQLLFSGKLSLQLLMEQLGHDSVTQSTAARALSLLVRAEESIREAIHQVNPADSIVASLGEQLTDAAEEVRREFGADVSVTADLASYAPGWDPDRTSSVVTAVREALVNAAKHAGPCRISLGLRQGRGFVEVTVADDGRGLPGDARPGYGIEAVRRRLAEQGAEFVLQPGRGAGTEAAIRVSS